MTTAPSTQALSALRQKYRDLVALAVEKQRAQACGLPGFAGPERQLRRQVMAAVAAAHPGALREMRQPVAWLQQRLAVLDACLAMVPSERGPWLAAHPWVQAVLAYHLGLSSRRAAGAGAARGRGMTAQTLAGCMRQLKVDEATLRRLLWEDL